MEKKSMALSKDEAANLTEVAQLCDACGEVPGDLLDRLALPSGKPQDESEGVG